MKPMTLNMSKVKKVAGDKEKSTFQHEDGHVITVLHKALPALQRKQLEAMPLFEGGMPAHMHGTDEGQPDTNNKQRQSGKSNPVPPEQGKQYFDEGTPDSPVQAPSAFESTGNAVSAGAKSLGLFQPGTNEDVANQMPAGPGKDAAMRDLAQESQPEQSQAAPQEQPQAAAPQDQSQAAPQVSAPVPEPKDPLQAQEESLDSRYQRSIKGMTDNDAALKQSLGVTINPDHLFHDKSVPSKIGTAIALILGGIGSGLTHQPNAALEMMDKMIDRDVDAQKTDQTNKMNVYKQLLASGMSEQNAILQTKNMLRQTAIDKVEKQMGNLPGGQANLRAQALHADLSTKIAQDRNTMAIADLQREYRDNPAQFDKLPISQKVMLNPMIPQEEGQKQASGYESLTRAHSNVDSILNQLDKEQTTGNLANPQSYKRVNQLKADLVNSIMQASPSKRLNEEFVKSQVEPLVTSTSETSKTRGAGRAALHRMIDSNAGPMNLLIDNGIIPRPGSQQSKEIRYDAQGNAWQLGPNGKPVRVK